MDQEKKDEIVNEEEVKIDETVETSEEEVVSESTESNEESLKEDELKDLKKEFMLFKDKSKRMENELEAYKDRLLRLSAEYENYRKRTEKEKERIYTDACEDVLVKMLPVLDNLERAISVENSSVEAYKTGVEMTIKQFIDALEKLGVEEIETENGFDPNLHQAVMHIQDENFDANQVAEVFQKGYKKGDKVIRFTMVKVAN
ncbi:nucleotide exchange factor GrpE [Clostridium mediterraneense]|uniref:nucleotide exchange factor GrpE n=1 Tax=Clostridium mediterraneense TaxID=1805472 RepID=UPI000834D7B1|nr:nucleotide exchange factor GrpE [Clostridium mediterraneense]